MTEQKSRQTRVKMGPDASHRWEQRFSIPENDGREYDRVQYLLH